MQLFTYKATVIPSRVCRKLNFCMSQQKQATYTYRAVAYVLPSFLLVVVIVTVTTLECVVDVVNPMSVVEQTLWRFGAYFT